MSGILNRKGRFHFNEITMVQLDKCNLLEQFWQRLKFIPLKVEFDYSRGGFNCVGLSSLFKSIEEGSEIPMYQITIQIKKIKKKFVLIGPDIKIHELS